jgi:hypothetical protein
MLGVAAAEAPTTNPQRTVTVQGVASVPIEETATQPQAVAAYRQAMAAAVTDGQEKAAFLAGKASVTPGAVQTIAEQGGAISCTVEGEYAEYRGAEPDWASSPSGPRILSGAARPVLRSRKAHRPAAKKAGAVSCTLRAQVTLSYALS